MIVLCPKAFSSNDGLSHERDFLKYFLSKTGEKGIIANEVWETFRLKMFNSGADLNKIKGRIADFKGIFSPEEEKIGNDHQEIIPTNEYKLETLVDKTKNLLERRWAEISLFITTEPEYYEDVIKTRGIEMLTLQEFLLSNMRLDKNRSLLEEFWNKTQNEKWDYC